MYFADNAPGKLVGWLADWHAHKHLLNDSMQWRCMTMRGTGRPAGELGPDHDPNSGNNVEV